jgi:hypothetical protein
MEKKTYLILGLTIGLILSITSLLLLLNPQYKNNNNLKDTNFNLEINNKQNGVTLLRSDNINDNNTINPIVKRNNNKIDNSGFEWTFIIKEDELRPNIQYKILDNGSTLITIKPESINITKTNNKSYICSETLAGKLDLVENLKQNEGY